MAFLAYKVDIWWTFANTKAQKLYGDSLICKKTYWSAFSELTLLECSNKKGNFTAQKVVANFIKGRLYAESAWLKVQQSSSAKMRKFPSIPRFIKEINLKNLRLALQKPLDELLPNKFNFLVLQRKPFAFGEAWDIDADAPGAVQMKGLLGDRIDAKVTVQNYPVKIRNSGLKASGEVLLKTEYLFQKPMEIILKQFVLSNIQSAGQKLPNALINSQFTLDKDLKLIIDVKDISVQMGELQIFNSPENPYLFKLPKTSFKNLLPFILPFEDDFGLKSLNLSSGTLAASFELHKANTAKSVLELNFDSLGASFNTKSSGPVKISGLSGTGTFLPIQIAARASKAKSQNFESPRQLFDYLGIQSFRLSFPQNTVANLGLGQLAYFKVPSGTVSGQIQYNKNLNGLIQINNLAVNSNNQDLGIHHGSGVLQILDSKASFKFNALNAHPAIARQETISLNGIAQLFPVLRGSVQGNIPRFSLQANELSQKVKWVNGDFSKINTFVVFERNSYKVQVLNGHINYAKGYLEPPGREYQVTDGEFFLDKRGEVQINKLHFATPEGLMLANLSLPINNLNQASGAFPGKLELSGEMSLADIQALTTPFLSTKIVQKLNDYQINGRVKGGLKIAGNNIQQLDFQFDGSEAFFKEQNLVQGLSGRLHFNPNSQRLEISNLNGLFNSQNKFKVNGILGIPANLNAFKNKNFMDSMISRSELHLNAFLNPNSLNNYLQQINPEYKPKVNFDEKVYLPLSASLLPDSSHSANLAFSSSFHKLQLYDGKIHLGQDMSKIENLTGKAHFDLKSKNFAIGNLFYSGKEFGVLVKADGKPDNLNFSVESSPLLDLGEIAKLWSDEYASGQFRGKVIAKNFNPQDSTTWLKNMEAEMHSEEDVHDFAYGILYGKHFQFNLLTSNGDGEASLRTRKGKLRNLQVTNLNTNLHFEDGLKAILKEFSVETADGSAFMNGEINMQTGDTALAGSMKDVNIETVSNNLFGNLGDYNGKGDLNYLLQGNFVDLLRSAPPDEAQGDFELKNGVMRQAAQLSKGLNLANLAFGLPLYFSFSTISHILQPEQDAAFWSIKGRWFFENDKKRIVLKDTVYKGINALHLSLNGEWDFREKDLNFDVYGFIPKRPVQVDLSEMNNSQEVMDLANKSRHFTFEVKGNVKNPDSIQRSVKRSINFRWFWPRREVQKRFTRR